MNDISGHWIPVEEEDGNKVGAGLLRAVGQILCGWHGHEEMLKRAPNSLYLECTHCGWRSDGIQIEARKRLVEAK